MAPRLKLQSILRDTIGSSNVYFQPPSTLSMQYPCIVYDQEPGDTKFADNFPYNRTKKYDVTYITRDPDSPIPDLLVKLPLCRESTIFTTDNLHHYVYTLFF